VRKGRISKENKTNDVAKKGNAEHGGKIWQRYRKSKRPGRGNIGGKGLTGNPKRGSRKKKKKPCDSGERGLCQYIKKTSQKAGHGKSAAEKEKKGKIDSYPRK